MATAGHSHSTWAGRRLHFVGIGGAGMSGLALIAAALGASVTGSDRAPSSYTDRLRQHGIEPVFGHAAANVPPAPRSSTPRPSRRTTPSAPAGRRGAAPRRSPRRDRRAAPLPGRDRHARQDDDVGDGGRTRSRAPASIPPTSSAASCAPPAPTPAGGRGSGSWSRPTSPTARCSSSSPEIAVLTNAELDHHSTYASRLDLEQTFATFMARAGDRAVVWDRPELRALCPGGGVPYDAPDAELRPERLALSLARHRGAAGGPGRPQRRQRRRRADRVRAGRRRSGGGRRGAGGVPRRPAADGAARGDRGRRRGLRRLRPPPHRGGRGDRGGAHRSAPRRLVAVFQPHLYSRTRALARGFGAALAAADAIVVLGDLSGARACRGLPGRERPARGRERRRRRRRAPGRVDAGLRRGAGLPGRHAARRATCA